MEDIKDRLGNYKYNFFNNLQNYIETELIFFGSIKRFDFFKNRWVELRGVGFPC